MHRRNSKFNSGLISLKCNSPVASYEIGQYFKEKGTEGSSAHILAHNVLGAAVAAAGGNDALTAGLTVGGAEATAPLLSKFLYDKESSDLSAEEKSTISAITGLVATGVGGATSGDIATAVQSGQGAQNAVENNYLTKAQAKTMQLELNAIERMKITCWDQKCINDLQQKKEEIIAKNKALSQQQDAGLKQFCFSNPSSAQCSSGIKNALEYTGGVDMNIHQSANLIKDKFDSSKNVLNIIYNSPQSKELITTRVQSIDDRANFFDANDYYYKSKNIDIRWFGAAEDISRTSFTGLGADGKASYVTFAAGKIIFGNPDLYGWRAEAGDALTKGGFNNFKNAFQGQYSSTKDWDINQLRAEQKILQPIHEKYLKEFETFRNVSEGLTKFKEWNINGGVVILDYKSRIEFGCRSMGYTKEQGCTP